MLTFDSDSSVLFAIFQQQLTMKTFEKFKFETNSLRYTLVRGKYMPKYLAQGS
jgi:hypothetical protein